MRLLLTYPLICCFAAILTGCSSGRDLLENGAVSIEQEATVMSVNVMEKEGKTWVTGVLRVTPTTDEYLYGKLHLEVLDSSGRALHHQDSCFSSFWQNGTYRKRGFYEMPQIQVMLSEKPKESSVIRMHPQLFEASCKPKHLESSVPES